MVSAKSGSQVAVLGGGKIGEALVSGLLRAGRDPGRIVVGERYRERARYLRETYRVQVIAEPAKAAAGADVLVVAVKPPDVATLLGEIADVVHPGQLVVSVAAGITIASLEAALGGGVPVVRCMPNTPALVAEGMTAVAGGTHAGPGHLDNAQELLKAVGKVVRVQEDQLDAVTAVSGSGPGYFFFLVEAMIDAGVLVGLPRPLATELVVQTALGSATMLRDSGEQPVELRAAVSSPGGTTVAGIRELEVHGVRAALLNAVEAAARRSRALGSGD